MEAAIADFLKRLEVQGKRGCRDLDAALSRLPIPKEVDQSHQTGVSVTAAIMIEAGMLPHMEVEEARSFNPSEVLLYQLAQDRRCVDVGYLCSI